MSGGLDVDDATLLRHYRMGSLNPSKWEDVDHDVEEGVPQSLSSPTTGGAFDMEVKDPLGLGAPIDYSKFDSSVRSSVMTSSKNFDPKTFLNVAHPDLSYQDLSRGISHLKKLIEARSEAIKVLVEEDFDRFVAVKSSTDAVYAEMQEGILSKESEYGSQPLRGHLKDAMSKADQIFQPILENSKKTEKARATLGVFERSKFLFNLPVFLRDSISLGRYDAALRDYKKGKYLFESRPAQLLPASAANGKDGKDGGGQRRILEKVWQQVEKVMEDLRVQLLDKLTNASLGPGFTKVADDHERTIEILMELGGSEDPVWIFLDSQHKRIMDRFQNVHDTSIAAIEECQSATTIKYQSQLNSIGFRTAQLQRCLAAIKAKSPEQTVVAQEPGHEVWVGIAGFVKNLSEVLVQSLPSFWKVARGYMDGRLKKSATEFGRSPAECRTMAEEITQTYINYLSSFFCISPETSALPSPSIPYPPWFPAYGNSLTVAYFLSTILTSLSESLNELNQVTTEISQGEQKTTLSSLLENLRWKFGEILSKSWKSDAKIFYTLETWQFDSQADPKGKPITITTHLSAFETFQRHITTSAFKIAGGLEVDSRSGAVRQNQIGDEYKTKITKTFLDSLYAFLDGLVHLASEEGAPNVNSSPTNTRFESKGSGALVPFPGAVTRVPRENGGGVEAIDIRDNDTRLLLVVSNLVYAHDTLLPAMFNELETAFGIAGFRDRKSVLEMTRSLDRTLFDDFVEKKAAVVIGIIRSGILDASIDWYEIPPPTEVRPYMYEALMYLVEVHSLVSKVARRLLDRALQSIIEMVATECLACFKQIPRFGIGGMLRATLEIEFMHQNVSRYTTDNKTEAILVEVYNSISQSYSRRPGDQPIQAHLGDVKKTLAEARKNTGIAFMCFRPSREEETERRNKKAKEKEKEATTTATDGMVNPIPKSGNTSMTSLSEGLQQSRTPTPRPPRRPRDRSAARP